jgi:hypothetical protein
MTKPRRRGHNDHDDNALVSFHQVPPHRRFNSFVHHKYIAHKESFPNSLWEWAKHAAVIAKIHPVPIHQFHLEFANKKIKIKIKINE